MKKESIEEVSKKYNLSKEVVSGVIHEVLLDYISLRRGVDIEKLTIDEDKNVYLNGEVYITAKNLGVEFITRGLLSRILHKLSLAKAKSEATNTGMTIGSVYSCKVSKFLKRSVNEIFITGLYAGVVFDMILRGYGKLDVKVGDTCLFIYRETILLNNKYYILGDTFGVDAALGIFDAFSSNITDRILITAEKKSLFYVSSRELSQSAVNDVIKRGALFHSEGCKIIHCNTEFLLDIDYLEMLINHVISDCELSWQDSVILLKSDNKHVLEMERFANFLNSHMSCKIIVEGVDDKSK